MVKSKWGTKKITEIIEDAETKQSELKTIFDDIQKTSNQINSVATEANEKLENISSVKNQVDGILSGVKTVTGDIQNVKNEIENLKLSTDELLKTNQSLVEEIKNQLGIAAGGSLSHTFNDRKEELGKSIKKWFWWLIGDITALAVIALFVFLELKSNPTLTPTFLLKFTLSFPFIYGAFFFHSQFNKEKQLLEEYAFKSAVSLSLEAYRQLLRGEINEGQDKGKIIEFMTTAINKIYTSPRENISNHPNKEDNIEIGILGEVAEIFKKIINK